MKKIFKLIPIILSLVFGLRCLFTLPTYADGSTSVCSSNVPASVKEAAGCNNNSDNIVGVVQFILNSIIAVIGIVAVIFIVVGGINFMTSTGDPGKVAKAKQTILYALIGLIICALAFAIVNWTIAAINGSSAHNDSDDTGFILTTSNA